MKSAILLILLALAVSFPASTATASEKEFKEYLDAAEKLQQFTGVAMVASDGGIVYAQACGRADFETNRLNHIETRFAIGSITKQFTAAAVMLLREKGKLSLDDPIVKYFPDFPEEIANKVTIRHLLTHTSGIVNFTDIPAYTAWKGQDTPLAKQILTIASLPLEFEPGTKCSYSNSNYKLLEAIINQVSGQLWHVYVKENILVPAGMTHTGYDLMSVDKNERAFGYHFDEKMNPQRTLLPLPGSAGAAGALYSTVGDLVKWDEALRGEKILKRESVEAMLTPNLDNYGFGMMIDSVGSYQRNWHDGLIDGFCSMFIRIPREKLCIVVLANNHMLDQRRLANSLMAIALGMPYDVPVLKTPVAIDTSRYRDYVGAYDLGNNQYRLITSEDGRLYSQRSGGMRSEIFPESTDKFFYEMNNATTITFLRDQAGVVVAHVIHQEGVDSRHGKLPDERTAAIMAKTAAVAVDPALFDRYVGEYQLSPVFSITIERKGKQIFAQATGQQQFEIFPKSETRYFFRVVDAEIEFVLGTGGKAESLILYQGGIEQKAMRVK